MNLKFNYNKIKLKTKTGIKNYFNSLSVFFDWTYFKKIEIKILNPFVKRRWKNIDERMNARLLKACGRKKNKLTYTNKYRIFFFEFIYIKIEIMSKHEYRKTLKKAGLLKT